MYCWFEYRLLMDWVIWIGWRSLTIRNLYVSSFRRSLARNSNSYQWETPETICWKSLQLLSAIACSHVSALHWTSINLYSLLIMNMDSAQCICIKRVSIPTLIEPDNPIPVEGKNCPIKLCSCCRPYDFYLAGGTCPERLYPHTHPSKSMSPLQRSYSAVK